MTKTSSLLPKFICIKKDSYTCKKDDVLHVYGSYQRTALDFAV